MCARALALALALAHVRIADRRPIKCRQVLFLDDANRAARFHEAMQVDVWRSLRKCRADRAACFAAIVAVTRDTRQASARAD